MIVRLLFLIFSILVLLYCSYLFFVDDDLVLTSGVEIQESPIQTKGNLPPPEVIKGYEMTYLANFEAKGKVLSTKRYESTKTGDIMPIDIAIGWQSMSDNDVLKDITIWQSNRWYRWRVKEFPIPRSQIETQSTNIHMVPKNDEILKVMKSVKKGQLIKFRGYLVKLKKGKKFWLSSLTRKDVGDGACEVVFVESFHVI